MTTEPSIWVKTAKDLNVSTPELMNSYFRRISGTTTVREAAAELNQDVLVYRQAEIKLTQWLREQNAKRTART